MNGSAGQKEDLPNFRRGWMPAGASALVSVSPRKAQRRAWVQTNFRDPKRNNGVAGVDAARPIACNDFGRKFPPPTFDFNSVPDHGHRSVEQVLVLAKLRLRDDFSGL